MTEKCYKLYGTKILNLQTQEIGLLICLWKNKFADGDIDFATCVDKQGKRDASLLEVGDILVADGHKLAFQVINPFTGKPTIATLVGFLDWKSTALVSYEIMLEENTQCIASALRNSIINLDMIDITTH